MSEDIATYYVYKMAFSIPFDIKESNYEYNEIYFKLNVMDYLKEIVKELSKENLFSKKVKDNIKNYLLQARDYKDKDRKERIDIINDILSYLNTQEKDNSLDFYASQLYLRRNSKRYLFARIDDIIREIDNVHNSLVCDYLILGTHLESMSEEIFKKHFFQKFIESKVYIESINSLLDEMPQLFNNSTFYKRVMDVLEMKKFFQDNNDKLYKQVNKKIKQINNKNNNIK